MLSSQALPFTLQQWLILLILECRAIHLPPDSARGRGVGCRGEGEEHRIEGRHGAARNICGQHRRGMWSLTSSWKWVFSSQKIFRILLATTAVWFLLQSASGSEILHAWLVLTLIWKDIIGKSLISFVQTCSMRQYFSLPKQTDASYRFLNVTQQFPFFAGHSNLAFFFFLCLFFFILSAMMRYWIWKHKTGKSSSDFMSSHSLDLHWEVTGPLYCLQPCNFPEFILHREGPQQPGQYPLSSSEKQSRQ